MEPGEKESYVLNPRVPYITTIFENPEKLKVQYFIKRGLTFKELEKQDNIVGIHSGEEKVLLKISPKYEKSFFYVFSEKSIDKTIISTKTNIDIDIEPKENETILFKHILMNRKIKTNVRNEAKILGREENEHQNSYLIEFSNKGNRFMYKSKADIEEGFSFEFEKTKDIFFITNKGERIDAKLKEHDADELEYSTVSDIILKQSKTDKGGNLTMKYEEVSYDKEEEDYGDNGEIRKKIMKKIESKTSHQSYEEILVLLIVSPILLFIAFLLIKKILKENRAKREQQDNQALLENEEKFKGKLVIGKTLP